MAKRFEGKVVIVTGGSSGIGLSTAVRLSEEGAKVVIVGRTEDKLQKAATDIQSKTGGEVKTVQADVSVKASNDQMVQEAFEAFGQVDAAFLNAGNPFRNLCRSCRVELTTPSGTVRVSRWRERQRTVCDRHRKLRSRRLIVHGHVAWRVACLNS